MPLEQPRSSFPNASNVRPRALLILVAFLWPLLLGARSRPVLAESAYRLSDIKVGILYNIARFVDWSERLSPDDSSPFVVCVLGEDPFGRSLEILTSKTIKDHQMAVRRLASPALTEPCHILFISSSENARLEEILDSVNGSGVLTIGEMDRFVDRGGIIGLKRRKNRIGFEVNLGAAEAARLTISSKVLSLALRVER